MLLLGATIVVLLAAAVAWAGWLAPRQTLRLEARTIAADAYGFAPAELTAPADTPVRLTFFNGTDAPHALVLLGPIDRHGQILYPDQADSLEFTTPAAGSYRFVCNVHENMSGALVIVEGE
jgi:plastocyanin